MLLTFTTGKAEVPVHSEGPPQRGLVHAHYSSCAGNCFETCHVDFATRIACVYNWGKRPLSAMILVVSTFGFLPTFTFAQSATPGMTTSSVPVVAHKVHVRDHSLYINCVGNGSPTVVMDAGYGDSSDVWTEIQQHVAASTRVCVYDRAGLGRSDIVGKRTVWDVVDDLASLLENCPVEGPYVLVRHSIGGLIANMYAHGNPEKVAGMVLVDSSHPNQAPRLHSKLPLAWLKALEIFFAGTPAFETWDSETATAQGRTPDMRAGSLGDKPIVVLTRDVEHIDPDGINWIKENIWSGYSAEVDRLYGHAWLDLQREYVALSTAATHVVVEGSTHYIQKDRPKVVTDAIRQVLKAARTRKPDGLTASTK